MLQLKLSFMHPSPIVTSFDLSPHKAQSIDTILAHPLDVMLSYRAQQPKPNVQQRFSNWT